MRQRQKSSINNGKVKQKRRDSVALAMALACDLTSWVHFQQSCRNDELPTPTRGLFPLRRCAVCLLHIILVVVAFALAHVDQGLNLSLRMGLLLQHLHRVSGFLIQCLNGNPGV